MNLPDQLLDILCCPVSHEPLLPLARKRLEKLNQAIARGKVLHVDGSAVTATLSDALIARDENVIYAIEDSIPVLLPERGIGMTQFGDGL